MSALPAPAELTFRPLAEDDLPAVLDLLTASLAGGPTGTRTADFFGWKHRLGPFGASPGLVAETPQGRLAGVRLFLRWQWHEGSTGRTVTAVRPVDTATHPDFQGRGVFRRLTLDLLGQVAGEAELVFNTPNGNSLPGYRKMGWQELGRVPVALRPVRPAAFARGVRAALARTPAGAAAPPACGLPTARSWFADRVTLPDPPRTADRAAPDGPTTADRQNRTAGRAAPDAATGSSGGPAGDPMAGADGPLAELLRERAAADRADPRLAVLRTPEFLRWRYGEAPGLDYRVLTCHRGGELTGLAVGRPRRRGPLAEFTLADVLVRPGDRDSAARLLRAAARESGCDHVATHLSPGTEAAAAALRSGFLRAPRTGMTLAARTPTGRTALTLPDWRFTLGDLEVF
ncbi:GNAT family N-acetyltransferase [Kitasatospora sp. NPDC059973]|uniref:GNAT family N-acetyltransferase n=1 Tax=Kitasatospora sp. NPDC059973 TaxID=3347020 RepID=UPI0036A5D3E1